MDMEKLYAYERIVNLRLWPDAFIKMTPLFGRLLNIKPEKNVRKNS